MHAKVVSVERVVRLLLGGKPLKFQLFPDQPDVSVDFWTFTKSMNAFEPLARGTRISHSVMTTPEFDITRASLVSFKISIEIITLYFVI